MSNLVPVDGPHMSWNIFHGKCWFSHDVRGTPPILTTRNGHIEYVPRQYISHYVARERKSSGRSH